MSFVLGIFFFILGTIIGSFLNVVILRYNTGMGLEGRSQCFSCGKELRWFELIPLFSYLALRGKCARCKSKISWQYPLVEGMTGLIFLGLYLKYSYLISFSPALFGIAMLYSLIIFSILIVIFVYDLRHKIIPDGLVIGVSGIAFIKLFTAVPHVWDHGTIWNFLAGPLLALPFAALWYFSDGKWMGLGDAKFALAIGWILGLSRGISAIILSFWIGAGVSLCIIAVQKGYLRGRAKQLTMKSEIPFAPFLIIGLTLVFFFGIQVLSSSIYGSF